MIVFDAEPLVGYYGDERGSDRVDEHVRAVETGDRTGLVSTVTCTEVHYVVRRDDERRADAYLSRIRNWCRVVDAETVWEAASWFKHQYDCALGDAFTLGTAQHHDATALVGADDDYDGIDEVTTQRFRTESI